MQWEAEQCAEDGGGSGIMYLCSDLVIYVWNGKYKSYSEKRNFPPIPHEVSALMQVLRPVVTLFYRAKSKELCSME